MNWSKRDSEQISSLFRTYRSSYVDPAKCTSAEQSRLFRDTGLSRGRRNGMNEITMTPGALSRICKKRYKNAKDRLIDPGSFSFFPFPLHGIDHRLVMGEVSRLFFANPRKAVQVSTVSRGSKLSLEKPTLTQEMPDSHLSLSLLRTNGELSFHREDFSLDFVI